MRPILALPILFCLVGPAAATSSIGCASSEGDASVDLTLGNLPITAVVGAHVRAGDAIWSTLEGEGEPVISGQAFGDDATLRVDLTDPNVERVVAELRLFRAMEDDNYALAGTLRIPGVGAWAVTCVGP